MRAEIAQCGMSSPSVVEDLNVIKQTRFGLFAGEIMLSMHLLFFERGKEAFHDRIVPANAHIESFNGKLSGCPLGGSA